MPDLSALLANKRWVDCDADGFEFKVAYRPGMTSLKRQAELQRELRSLQSATDMDELEAVTRVAQVMVEMVCDWDLTNEGQPIPITVGTIIELPNVIYNAIQQGINDDGKVTAEEKKASLPTSVATSMKAERSAVAQNGIPQLEQRGTWA